MGRYYKKYQLYLFFYIRLVILKPLQYGGVFYLYGYLFGMNEFVKKEIDNLVESMDMHVYESKEKDFTKVLFHKDGTILMSMTSESGEPNSLIINTQSLNGIGNLRYIGFEHDKEYQDYLFKRLKDKFNLNYNFEEIYFDEKDDSEYDQNVWGLEIPKPRKPFFQRLSSYFSDDE